MHVSSSTCVWADAFIQVRSRRAMTPFTQHNKAQLSLVYIALNKLGMLLKFLERVLDTTERKLH